MTKIEINIDNAEELGFTKIFDVASWRNCYKEAYEKDDTWRKANLYEKYIYYEVTLKQMIESLPIKYSINFNN